MEQRFKTSGQDIDLLPLREFIEREGEAVAYRRGDQLEREGDPTRWFAFVTEGCFKYITYGLSDERAHITWFSFEGEYVGDYPAFLYGRPAQTTIEAMMPSRVMTGSDDIAEPMLTPQTEAMKQLPQFSFGTDKRQHNFYYAVLPGATHTSSYAFQYAYNALLHLWKNEPDSDDTTGIKPVKM